MINIEFTHQNKSGATSKLFTVPTEDISTDAKLPNQARQIAQYAAQYVDTHSAPFTFGDLPEDLQRRFVAADGRACMRTSTC